MHVQPKNVAVFDLDNCLAEDATRMHLIPGGDKHGFIASPAASNCLWNAYHRAGASAEPHNLEYFYDVALGLPKGTGVVVFLTARPEAHKDLTLAWLAEHGFTAVPRWALLMRSNNCLEDSPRMKPRKLQEWLHNNGMTLDNVALVHDDRRDVLRAFRALGVATELLAIEDRGE